ncbi:hypothetical protein BDN70DRAFT_722677 [Pholiota conissans]|uniref:Uncharacterized protein n=1 Tax=Pholiota conissans TaxID=109636 RepID=A0A9P6CT16_9AGAR|nr:hypothetical protein BDN70DRAFT_722677 [Pholiota conissans]
MAGEQSFPLDVVDIIIDLVADMDDASHTSLKACALASSLFLHSCRRHFFCSVTLGYGFHELKFLEVLGSSPGIANYVRKLKVAVNYNYDSRENKASLILASAIKEFRRVQHLEIKGHMGRSESWDTIPRCLQEAFFHLFPMIGSLQLSFFHQFRFSVLTRCVNLRCLQLYAVSEPVLDLTSVLPTRSIVLDEYSMSIGTAGAKSLDSILTLA